MNSKDQSDGKDVNFFNRPIVLIVGALILIAVILAIGVFLGDRVGDFLAFPNALNRDLSVH